MKPDSRMFKVFMLQRVCRDGFGKLCWFPLIIDTNDGKLTKLRFRFYFLLLHKKSTCKNKIIYRTNQTKPVVTMEMMKHQVGGFFCVTETNL